LGSVANEHAIDERMLSQAERVIHSDVFRSSEVLRHLLKFLADKSSTGEAEHLKEYTVAIDALGKPASYDPRHDSAVRIQVGRLRQKLAEYYRTEGKDDPIIIDLPKGRFKLTCEVHSAPEVEKRLPANTSARVEWILIWLAAAMWLTLLVAVAWGEYSTYKFRQSQADTADNAWTSDIGALWEPFVTENRPLILAVEDPLFVEFQRGSGVYYRDKGVNDWDTVLNSAGVSAVRKALNNPNVQPSRYYTALGEVNTSFLLGKLLGSRDRSISLVRTSQLSWQELADNNVLFVGTHAFFNSQLQGMPVHPQLVPDLNGIQDLHPNPGDPKAFVDNYETAPSEQGEVYALATHLPGPIGTGDIESFISNRAAGYVAAVQWFTDPHFATVLVSKLRKSSGEMPRYYQVLLKVRFKDDVPTETSFVLARELQ
jgi:hypothetical protein